MSDKKMLQAIIDGQSAIKEEFKKGINNVRKEVEKNGKKIDQVNDRVDKLGKHLAYIEDDTPTVEEFDELEKRVNKVEKQVSSI